MADDVGCGTQSRSSGTRIRPDCTRVRGDGRRPRPRGLSSPGRRSPYTGALHASAASRCGLEGMAGDKIMFEGADVGGPATAPGMAVDAEFDRAMAGRESGGDVRKPERPGPADVDGGDVAFPDADEVRAPVAVDGDPLRLGQAARDAADEGAAGGTQRGRAYQRGSFAEQRLDRQHAANLALPGGGASARPGRTLRAVGKCSQASPDPVPRQGSPEQVEGHARKKRVQRLPGRTDRGTNTRDRTWPFRRRPAPIGSLRFPAERRLHSLLFGAGASCAGRPPVRGWPDRRRRTERAPRARRRNCAP